MLLSLERSRHVGRENLLHKRVRGKVEGVQFAKDGGFVLSTCKARRVRGQINAFMCKIEGTLQMESLAEDVPNKYTLS